MEMFVVHVALTMSTDSCFVYVLIDCFKELTLSVFKNANYAFIFGTAMDDAVERFQIYFYVLSTLAQTRQDFNQTMRHVLILLIGECTVDYMKHYFILRLNKLNDEFYGVMPSSLFRTYYVLQQVKSKERVESFRESKC